MYQNIKTSLGDVISFLVKCTVQFKK